MSFKNFLEQFFRLLIKLRVLRYGENAWQTPAELFVIPGSEADPLAICNARILEGGPGYNNIRDIGSRAIQYITHVAAVYEKNFGSVPMIAIGTKHGNACGASAQYATEGYSEAGILCQMLDGQPISIFGGTVITNFPITAELANILRTHNIGDGPKRPLDVVFAPAFDSEAIEILSRKGDKCKIVQLEGLANLTENSLDTSSIISQVRGGFVFQPNYTFVPYFRNAEKNRQAKLQYEKDAALSWAIGSVSNSNTISLVKSGMLLANAVSQQDRVGAVQLAFMLAARAKHNVIDCVAYSDSYFPFDDGPKLLVERGVKMILATTGSIRDNEVKEVCKNIIFYTYPDAIARGFAWH